MFEVFHYTARSLLKHAQMTCDTAAKRAAQETPQTGTGSGVASQSDSLEGRSIGMSDGLTYINHPRRKQRGI
jgi:hypothetical protein